MKKVIVSAKTVKRTITSAKKSYFEEQLDKIYDDLQTLMQEADSEAPELVDRLDKLQIMVEKLSDYCKRENI